MLKTAAVLTRPPLRAKTCIAPNKATASDYIETVSDARTRLEDFFNNQSVEGKRHRHKGDDKHREGDPSDDRPISA